MQTHLATGCFGFGFLKQRHCCEGQVTFMPVGCPKIDGYQALDSISENASVIPMQESIEEHLFKYYT